MDSPKTAQATSPDTPRQTNARRDQLFDGQPISGPAQCPLKKELAIFPIRYAIDESPPKGTNQGPNPLPKGWSASHLPRLKTRSYTLRQLRDGWLYVWDETAREFHEYSVSGCNFTRHKWTSAQLNKDERSNPGETRPYLLYARSSRLSLAFSPTQWSWRVCERMRSNPSYRTAWMRAVNLPGFCSTMTHAHGGPLVDLGKVTADISPGRTPTFLTTASPCIASGDKEDQRPIKAVISEALVIGSVPNRDDALFIALDDPLAVVEDLIMHLAGRRMEQALYEQKNRAKGETAAVVGQLCGVDMSTLLPSSVKSDPARSEAFIAEAQAMMQMQNNAESQSAGIEGAAIGAGFIIAKREDEFAKKWGVRPGGAEWDAQRKAWEDRSLWRADVRYDEAERFLRTYETTVKQFLAHGQASETDLTTWLQRLGIDPLAFCQDPCVTVQCAGLLQLCASAALFLGNGETGLKWLRDELKAGPQAKTMLGNALYNFDSELAKVVERVSMEFARNQQMDISGQGDGSGSAYTGIGEATSITTRVSEAKAVLDLDFVKNSAIYRGASEAARQSLEGLRKGLRDNARQTLLKNWLMLAELSLPAIPSNQIPSFVTLQMMVSEETFQKIQVTPNPEHEAWQAAMDKLENDTAALDRGIERKAKKGTRRGRRDLHQLKTDAAIKREKIAKLKTEEPPKLVARMTKETRQLSVQEKAQAELLADLGRSELKAQEQLRAQSAQRYAQRLKSWVDSQLEARGGGLAITVAALNLWNLHASYQSAKRDGHFSEDELRIIAANMGYTINAIMGLWTGPMWAKYAGVTEWLPRGTTALARAGLVEWSKAGSSYAPVVKGLILRTMAFAAFGAVAAGLEAWQVSKDMKGATSNDEKGALYTKRAALLAMAGISTVQILGSAIGVWFSFAWVMGPVMAVAILIVGIIYLLSTLYANHFKREGLRLWLYRCLWGRSPDGAWLQGEQGHAEQMRALSSILLRPTVMVRGVSEFRSSVTGRGGAYFPLGFWLQILLPKESIYGKEGVCLQVAMVQKTWLGFGQDRVLGQNTSFYEQFIDGCWMPLSKFGLLPFERFAGELPADTHYGPGDTHRLWQTWVDYPAQPLLELEIHYPQAVLDSNPAQRGYQFRIDAGNGTEEAERKNGTFNFEPSEDMQLSAMPTSLLKLPIPE